MLHSFPAGVAKQLKKYVYRLIDPRNGETFYVGKGQGNRIFAHCRAEIKDDETGEKLKRILDIRNAGFEVAHVIHRHGMDDATAFEVEAALIDAYPGLTNAAGGAGSNDFGAMHAKEIVGRYEAKEAAFEHRVLLINVPRSATEKPLYEATRYAWKISPKRAGRAEVILAVSHGIILDAFVADRWLRATAKNFPEQEPRRKRHGFIGARASADIRKKYVGKRVPDKYRKKGAANPIKYTYQ